MKTFAKLFLLCLIPAFSMAQIDPTWGYVTAQQADSLKRKVQTEKNDTIKLAAFRSLGFYYQDFKPDSGLYFHEQQLVLAKKLKMKLWQADAYSQAGYVFNLLGNYLKSYEYHKEATELASDEKNEADDWRPWTFSNAVNGHEARIAILAMNYSMMGNLWSNLRENEKLKATYEKALKLGGSINNGKIISNATGGFSRNLSPDSALLAYNKALDAAAKVGFNRVGTTYRDITIAYWKKKMLDSAMIFARKSVQRYKEDNELIRLTGSYGIISFLFRQQNKNDSSLFYAKKQLESAQGVGTPNNLADAYRSLYSGYSTINKPDSALKYLQLSSGLRDSLNNARIDNLIEYQRFSFNELLRLKKLDEEKTAYANKLKMIGLVAGLAGILVVALILYRNNRNKQKANTVLESTLTNLKSTQSQLIQSEKMASLGELTAGIAHEIQNPLNFVNNFSEVNKELLIELSEELNKGNIDEAKTITNDAIENEDKIIHHGKRADAIVKNMLLHSRGGSGAKEPTDINAMADEYLRLSFHGMRARDKSFNARYETHFDNTIGKINVVQQEIGRVLLNLINNAFYAVNEKQNARGLTPNAESYEPTVLVSTKKEGGKVIISVKDNGNGIPGSIKEKIFQPFFTTKPTGQGTGLGLSLSYDIIKAHGGEIKVNNLENEGTEFIIQLPI